MYAQNGKTVEKHLIFRKMEHNIHKEIHIFGYLSFLSLKRNTSLRIRLLLKQKLQKN